MKENISLSDFQRLSYPKLTILVTAGNNIITLAWHSPISFSPPLYGVSIAPNRHSHDIIKNEKEFGVNFVTMDHLDAIKYCGTHSGKDVDKWAETWLTKEDAEKIKTPLIKEAIGTLECKLVQDFTCGDHTWFVGEVLAARAEENYLESISDYKKPYNLGGVEFATLEDQMK